MSDDSKAIGLVNESGFPFHRRVAHEIDSTRDQHGYRVEALEVPWFDRVENEGGFIDLVFTAGPIRFVVECKRRSGGSWAFLPTSQNPYRDAVRLVSAAGSPPLLHCHEYTNALAQSYQADACVVPGSGGRKRTLEPDASRLVRATEALAQLAIAELRSSAGQEFFIPMIVTNLPLLICEFDSSQVSLTDGTIDPATSSVKEVPYIRFRKSFAINPSDPAARFNGLNEVRNDRERTVFVVNAASLTTFLRNSA